MPPSLHPIYTVGYTGWSVEQLGRKLDELSVGLDEGARAQLIDIRLNPWSNRPEWRLEELRRSFKGRFAWAKGLGNKNYKGGPIELASPYNAISHIRERLTKHPVVLMCACADWRDCHRRVAANFLAKEIGTPIVHLEPPAPEAPAGYWRAITVKAPWGWAIMHALKDIENRNHRLFAGLRGEIVIHHSQRVALAEYLEGCEFIRRVSGLVAPHYNDAAHGCVLGTVEVTDFVQYSPSPWYMGAYGLVLRNPKPFEVPVPAKGKQGIWFWRPEMAA